MPRQAKAAAAGSKEKDDEVEEKDNELKTLLKSIKEKDELLQERQERIQVLESEKAAIEKAAHVQEAEFEKLKHGLEVENKLLKEQIAGLQQQQNQMVSGIVNRLGSTSSPFGDVLGGSPSKSMSLPLEVLVPPNKKPKLSGKAIVMTLYKRGQGQPPQGLHPITGSDRSVVAVFSHADSLSPLATIGETANKSSLDKLDKWKISDEYHYEDHSISELYGMSSMTPSDTPKLTLKNLPSREHTVYMISSSNPATDGLPKLSKKNHVGIGVKHNKLHLYNIDSKTGNVVENNCDISAFVDHYVVGVPVLIDDKPKWFTVGQFVDNVWPLLKIGVIHTWISI